MTLHYGLFFHKSMLHKLRSCYNKCIKLFFGYSKYASVTQALFETGVPSFDTVVHNAQSEFCSNWTSCYYNSLVYSVCCVISA